MRCLDHFSRHDLLDNHKEYCKNNEAIKTTMPKPDTFLSFKHHDRGIKVPLLFMLILNV